MLRSAPSRFALLIGAVATATAMAQTPAPDRSVLPIQQPKPRLYTELDARYAKPPPRFEVKAPTGAPNVLIVLIDDIGFGQSSAFGGPVRMPTVERLAGNGCASTSSTPRRCARPRAPRCSAAATTT